MPGPKPLIAGNWKMNGRLADAAKLAGAVAASVRALGPDGADVLVCPPFPHLGAVGQALSGSRVHLGAQDCHAEAGGAFTGDVAAEMLKDAGCSFVLVGHSERRALHAETDGVVQAKARAALRAGLTAIVCVGETLSERDGGRTLAVVAGQLAGSLPDDANAGNLVVAYEPVWAIGTGRTPTTAQVAEVHGAIRAGLSGRFKDGAKLRILYGGSVNALNAAELLAVADVDGALVGGASLRADTFETIIKAAPRR
ncbi:MAG: triose-phosphate isomerase [Rhodospirillales bacterium]|nr:triose-phosphate isomerase [Rhodospirillales bacterium]